jgi:uncharacterized membrane protein
MHRQMALKPTSDRGTSGVLPHVGSAVPQDPASLTPVGAMDEAGTRFLLTIPTDLPMRPIRAYAALGSASTAEARVELVMRELERQGAFRRKRILVGAPTGGGHINPVALELVERMARGDVASVAVQFGDRPSMLSLHKVGEAGRLLDLLSTRIRDRIRAEHPNGGGPQVLLYGESLGAWASRRMLDGAADRAERATGAAVDPLQATGIDRVVWIGTPGFSRFRDDRLGPGGVQALSGIEQLDSIDPIARRSARVWMLAHYDDYVHRADLSTIWRRPSWLPKDGSNPRGVGASERWRPLLTFLDTIRGAATSANQAQAGTFTNHGHDYRKALPRLLREAYGFGDVTDAELARITEQVRQSEVWILGQKWGA